MVESMFNLGCVTPEYWKGINEESLLLELKFYIRGRHSQIPSDNSLGKNLVIIAFSSQCNGTLFQLSRNSCQTEVKTRVRICRNLEIKIQKESETSSRAGPSQGYPQEQAWASDLCVSRPKKATSVRTGTDDLWDCRMICRSAEWLLGAPSELGNVKWPT